MRHIRPLYLYLLVAVIIAAILGASSCANQADRSNVAPKATVETTPLPEGEAEEFQLLAEIYSALKAEHLSRDSFDIIKLRRGAIKGLLETLDDPYASYLDGEQHTFELERFRGSFEGIGAEVTVRDDKITIVAPIDGTPAERAGIKAGDIILAVNGESIEGLGLSQVIARIRGPKGTSVQILILHRGQSKPESLTIVRDVVNVASVNLRILTGDIAHLKITTFGDRTAEEVAKALERVNRTEAKGIILDLRNNLGGLLPTVVDVTSQFLKDGLVLYEVDGKGRRVDWRVRPRGRARDIPMVVLVNEFSASGSEVVAGAFRDHGRATLIGTKTFGKGSVGIQRTLSDGSGLYFTIARWYTPKGTLIEGLGIEPDVVVAQTPEDGEDLQMDKAIELLQASLSKGG